MTRPRNLLNVRSQLEWTTRVLENALAEHKKMRTNLAPIFVQEFQSIILLNKAILRKHATRQTRKDIYVEAQP